MFPVNTNSYHYDKVIKEPQKNKPKKATSKQSPHLPVTSRRTVITPRDEETTLPTEAEEQPVRVDLISQSLTNSISQSVLKILITPHLTLKVYLFMMILVTCSVASYMVAQSVAKYLDFEVITTTRTIYEKPSLFPKVTICNQNMFTTQVRLFKVSFF